MSEIVRKVAVVHGRVQGVFFRDSCRREAEKLGVAGSALNLPDGTVEVVLEGAAESVERMLEWCRKGPPHADVARVDVREESPRGTTGFTAG